MKLSVEEAISLSNKVLAKIGFSKEDAELITKNLVEAELAEKKTHGFVRLPAISRNVDAGKIKIGVDTEIISETNNSLYINVNFNSGFPVIYKSLEQAIKKVKKYGVVIVGIKDAAYASGFIGSYAKEATKNDLVFIGFNNSPGGLIPHGATKELWGTNPLTVGIPSLKDPVILDMASSQITWGDLMVAKQEGRTLKEGVALDENGQPTNDPSEAIKGGLLPFFGRKGSGLGFVVELLGGALTGSLVGTAVKGGWGTTYILINPELFRPISDFKSDVSAGINELKSLPKAKGVEEIYYPGEQSQKKQDHNAKNDAVDISENLHATLEEILNG